MYTALDTPHDSEPAVVSRLGEDAYSAVKHRLLSGEFAINVRLVETRLAAELGVSRTPVREALNRLAAELLLRPHPDGGFQPRVPDTAAIGELYEVRAALELHALRRPMTSGVPHQMAILYPLRAQWVSLQTGPPPMPSPEFVLLDEAFHVALALASGNRATAEMLGRVNEQIRIVRMQDFLDEERIRLTIDEHLEILSQVESGDLAAAETAFTTHLSDSLAFVSSRTEAAIARMVSAGRASASQVSASQVSARHASGSIGTGGRR
jgi:DNA-binding GntR family transcriptional regulator